MVSKRTVHIALGMTTAALFAATGLSAQGMAPMSPHIGHVMTSYKDVPDQKGFLEIANLEADVAIQHAKLGMADLTSLDKMKLHAGHVLNALDPSLMPKGPGKGYGLKKAADNIAAHITMAGQAADAPQAVKTHSVHVAQAAKNTSTRAEEMIEIAQKIENAKTAAEAKPLFEQLNALAQQLKPGVDANKDGTIDWKQGEGGLDVVKQHMDLMMKGMGM